jgi:CRP-like cAMP-binding protein
MQKVLFLFAELNDDDIDWLITKGTTETVPSGTTLIHQDQEINYIYILLRGTVSVSIKGDREIAHLASGEIFGEMSFMDSRLPSANVTTTSEAIVLSLEKQVLADRLRDNVGFASRFYRAISIFLSSRLRGALKYLGYDQDFLPQLQIDVDELAEEILYNVGLAKSRYDWLLRRTRIDELEPLEQDSSL